MTSTGSRQERVAFITTPKYRDEHADTVKHFIYRYLYTLCNQFEVLSTGRTYDLVKDVVSLSFDNLDRGLISESMDIMALDEHLAQQWRDTILGKLVRQKPRLQGMIEIGHKLVEGRLDAIIHLTDWDDVSGKPDSMVLRRQANVHNVAIASDIHTAVAAVRRWKAQRASSPNGGVFPSDRPAPNVLPLAKLEGKNSLAIIAHDAMKLEACRFAVAHRMSILAFDYILSTGHTGMWLKRFLRAAGASDQDTKRVICCLSGPRGGDVQIAAAVVYGHCRRVIFFQDAFTSHAHETDIRLFEQAVLSAEIKVELATNAESAQVVLGDDLARTQRD